MAAWMAGHDLHDHVNEPDQAPMRASAFDVQTVIFSSLWLWLLIDAVPRVLGYGVQLVYVRTAAEAPGESAIYAVAAMVDLVVRFGIGIGLLFGSATVARWVNRVRNAGLEEHERPDHMNRSKS